MSSITIDRLVPSVRAKSDGTPLRSHLAVVGQVARALLAASGSPPCSGLLVTAATLHDIGKAGVFQDTLDGGAWRCHEEDAPDSIHEFLSDGPSRRWLAEIVGELRFPSTDTELDDVVALAVTHHGRRCYVPGLPGGALALTLSPRAEIPPGRLGLTEFDLLFRYRPWGGIVILADQIGSALQGGASGTLVNLGSPEALALPPMGDLADEPPSPAAENDLSLLPQGNGLERLLLDGLGIARVEAHRSGNGWTLVIDGTTGASIRSDI